MKRAISILCLLTVLLTAGCGADATVPGTDDGYQTLRDSYFCVSGASCGRQAWKLNIADGSILVACPDPICGHGPDDVSCPFRGVIPVSVADGGRYMFYIGWGPDGNVIYCFDTEENATSVIYKYDKLGSNWLFLFGEGRLYFDVPQMKTANGEIIETTARTVMYYDTGTGKTGVFGTKDERDRVQFVQDGKLYYRNESSAGLFATDGSFDGSEPVELPEGGKYGPWGDYYTCGPGYIVKSYPPGDIYLFAEGRSVPMPPETSESIMVGTTATSGTFYFTLGSFTAGYNLSEETEDGHYTGKVCILDSDGSYRLYSVQSNFSFYVVKGFGNRIVCEVLSEYSNGADLIPGTNEENTKCSHLLIDLDSGKVSAYNVYAESADGLHLYDAEFKIGRVK